METSNLIEISRKKCLLFFACLLMPLTLVFAQIGETHEQRANRLQRELNTAKEEAKKRSVATEQQISELRNTVRKLEAILEEKENELQEALLKVERLQSGSLIQTEERYRRLQEQLETVRSEKATVQKELEITTRSLESSTDQNVKLKTTVAAVQHTFPFTVTDVKFKNVNKKAGTAINNYDQILSKIQWLTIQIHYTNLLEEAKNIDLIIRVYNPKGELMGDPKISTTYTVNATNVRISSKEGTITVNEWKSGKSVLPEKYKAGRYRVEIWHRDVCLGQKFFDIVK